MSIYCACDSFIRTLHKRFDDDHTGYSSLNMFSVLRIKVPKIKNLPLFHHSLSLIYVGLVWL